MNRILFLIIPFLLNSCLKKEEEIAEKTFHITTYIDKNMDGKMAYLKSQENGNLVTIDSAVFEDAKVEFKGSIDKPVVYGLFIDGVTGALGLFMENEIMTVQAYKDSLETSKITGSKTNDVYLDFVKKSNAISSKMNSLFPIFQKARAENDVEKLEEINAKMRAINDENSRFALAYAKKHPDSYIAAFALQSIISTPTVSKDTVAKVYNRFSDYVKMGDFSLKISDFLENTSPIDSLQN